jgi:PAS domain S-box-containing protein
MINYDFQQILPKYLLDSKVLFVVITDLEGKYIFTNNYFNTKYQSIYKDILGTPSLSTIYHEDHSVCIKTVNKCLEYPDQVFQVKLRKPYNKQNDSNWTNWEFSAIKGDNDELLGILCIGHDITDTEMISIQNKELLNKIEVVYNEITDGYYVLDRNWNFIRINITAEQILGKERKEIVGKNFWNFFPDDDRYNYPSAFKKSMNEYKTVTFEEHRNDLDKWFQVACYPTSEGLAIYFKDITNEVKSREQLTKSENQLRAVLNSTIENQILIDINFNILNFSKSANELCLNMLNKNLEIGRKVWEYIVPKANDKFQAYFNKAMKGENLVIERKLPINSERIWFEFKFFPTTDFDGKLIGVSLIVINIDKRKKTEMKILSQNKKLRSIAWHQSHELRGPVARILGLSNMLQMMNTDLTEDFQEYLKHLNKTTKVLDEVVEKIVSEASVIEVEK